MKRKPAVMRLPRAWLARLSLSAAVLLAACSGDDPVELLRSARDYQAKNDHPAAIIQLKNVLQKQPQNGEARLLLANSALVTGDAPTAAAEFRKAMEYGQPREQVVPLLAEAMLESGDAEKLITEFKDAKLADPKAEAELRASVGDAYQRVGSLNDAAVSFAAALTADPKNVRARLGQVRLMTAAGKLDDALAAVDAIVAENPQSADALVLSSAIKAARGDRAGARAALEHAVAAVPANPALRYQLLAFLIAERDFDAAAEQVASARAARVSGIQMQYYEAVIAFGRKDVAKARALAEQVLKRAPNNVQTLVLIGTVELQEKKYAEAESHLQRVLLLAPNHVGARALLGRSYLLSKQPARALDTLKPLGEAAGRLDPEIALLLGEAYLANGDLKQASVYFTSAAKSKSTPQQAAALTRLGQVTMLKGDVNEAVRELEAVTAREDAPLQAELALVAAYVNQGQHAKALTLAESLVKKRPDDPIVHQTLGSVRLARKEPAAARASFSKAVELDPLYTPAVASLAQLDLNEKRPADARARFEAVLAKDPKNEQAMLGLAEVLARTRAPSAEIAAVLQRAIAAQPGSVSARLALINLYLRDRDSRAALAAAQEAAASLSQDARILDALGRAQLAAGDTNQAIETFNRTAKADPRSVAPYLRLASVYSSRKELDKAADSLLKAQQIAPGDPNVAGNLVVVYLAMDKENEALKQAKGLQAASPSSAMGLMLEGDVHAARQRWTPAERAYREALKLEPAAEAIAVKVHHVLVASKKNVEADAFIRKWLGEHPKGVATRSYLAEQSLKSRDWKGAAAQYETIVAQQPDNVPALNNYAWALGQLDDAKALGYAERALSLAPENPAVLDTMGTLLTMRGDGAKGSEYLEKAVALAPERHDIRLNYAKALLKAGRAEDAGRELARLSAVTDDFPGKADIPALLKK